MKKFIALLLCLSLCLCMFAGCDFESHTADADGEIKIVTTIFPIYDWTMNIIGEDSENYSVTMLVDNGVDMHSYQASTADMVTIHTCDILIYVGGESDSWVEDLLATTTNTNMQVIKLVDVLGDAVVFEELVEGMEETEHSHNHDDEEDHDHDHEDECCDEEHEHDDECCDEDHDHEHEHDEECCDEDHDHEHEHDEECCDEDHDHAHEEDCCDEEIDEHVWLSLQNASVICSAIADTLSSINPASESKYSANLASYTNELEALDSEYAEMVSLASLDTILFADRFPFRYLVDDYNLNYYAAFAGCSSETEASFETIVFLAGKIDELSLDCVLTVEGATHKIADTVISATQSKDQTVYGVNSMETVTSADYQAGTTYLSIMRENLEIFKLALN